MSYLRLLKVLLRRGSLFHEPHDFELERRSNLGEQYIPGSTSKNIPAWKKSLLQSRLGYGVISNLAYFRHAREMNKMLFIADEQKLVYIRMLKAGSTSMLKAFLPLVEPNLKGKDLNDKQIDALGYYYAGRALGPQQAGYTKFALVRDPFRRLVSVYLDLFDPKQPSFSYATYWFGILKKEMTFAEFVDILSVIPQPVAGPHLTAQSLILKLIGTLEDITLLKIEEPDKLDSFLVRYGLSLSHRNRQPSAYDYTKYYDAQTLSKAYKLYQDDIRLLGYEKEYEEIRDRVNQP